MFQCILINYRTHWAELKSRWRSITTCSNSLNDSERKSRIVFLHRAFDPLGSRNPNRTWNIFRLPKRGKRGFIALNNLKFTYYTKSTRESSWVISEEFLNIGCHASVVVTYWSNLGKNTLEKGSHLRFFSVLFFLFLSFRLFFFSDKLHEKVTQFWLIKVNAVQK